jgi:ubiquinone/menaquinone biosynthesis C-methylase UbiE
MKARFIRGAVFAAFFLRPVFDRGNMETQKTIDGAVEKIGAYWDGRSSTFDAEHDTEDRGAWESVLEKLLGDDRSKTILDMGTGTGFLANMTARMGYPSIGLDVSLEMMRLAVVHAAEYGSNAVFMRGNVLELPFMGKTVDFIINARLLWTMLTPDLCIKEWFRVLKPGGGIYCFNRMKEGVGLVSNDVNPVYQDEEVRGLLAIRNARMEELTVLFERNGLEQVRIEKLPGLTRPEFDYDPWFVLAGSKPMESIVK